MNIKDISSRRAAQNAAFQALPVALIVKPLRFINANTEKTAIRSPLGKLLGYKPSPEYQSARASADVGNGGRVQALARQVLSA